MEIQKGNNRFYIERDGTDIAEITWQPKDEDRLVVDHTYVSDELRGQGIAGQLVDKMVQFAREENKKIIPLCPYVKVKLDKDEKYQDVVAD